MPTVTSPVSAIAAVYQRGRELSSVSVSTASRPMRRITSGGGTLPLRKPGSFISRPSRRAVCWTWRSTSADGTSASTRTRDSGRSVTVAVTGEAMSGRERYRPPMRARLATWLVTGPVGHLVAGAIDWLALLGRYGWARARGRDPSA